MRDFPNKNYWIWYWSCAEVIQFETDIEGYQIFFDFNEMKNHSANHGFLNKHRSGYWSGYDKVEGHTIGQPNEKNTPND